VSFENQQECVNLKLLNYFTSAHSDNFKRPAHCYVIVDRNVNAVCVMEVCCNLLTMLQCCDVECYVVNIHRL
jgi:hypothetical protein